MQFGGQRTDMSLKPVGQPHNVLIKMTEDVLPDPYAILVTGITPQQTIADGMTEAEFLKLFYKEIAVPDTIFVGYNTVRFDDEFMRFLLYRNFYDPYTWQYKDERSRWDLLDAVRMMRALRPEGIKWPVDSSGKPTNQLGLLTGVNNIAHDGAHDALSDVNATIALAQLIHSKQPKLFKYLLDMRDKKRIAELVDSDQPFVYTSGKYPSETQKTTIAVKLASHPKRQGALVYDLRHDPEEFTKLSPEELVEAWQWKKDSTEPRLPVKTLQYNRCPAVAPLNVLDSASQKRIGLTPAAAMQNLAKLKSQKEFVERILKAVGLLDDQQALKFTGQDQPVDAQLYDGFFSDSDRRLSEQVQALPTGELSDMQPKFQDKRLKALLPLYKARNFPSSLTTAEQASWDRYCQEYVLSGGEDSRLARYFAKLEELKKQTGSTKNQQYILDELQLWGESLVP